MNERKEDGSTLCEFRMGRKSVHENLPEFHRVGVAFSEGSEAFTVLRESRQVATFTAIRPYPVSHFYRLTANTQITIEKRAQPRRGVALVGVGERLIGRMLHFRRSASRCVGHAMQEYRTVKSPVHELHSRSAV